MMNIKNLSDKTTFCLFLTVITVGYVYLSHRYMPIIANDALNGLVTSHNYELTEIWNTHYYLSDSLQITSTFLTWWAPGQYVIPLFFSALLGVSLGFAISISCGLSLYFGALLYYELFVFLQVEKRIINFSLSILILQRFVNLNFFQYSSSDIYLFCIIPLITLFFIKYTNSMLGITKAILLSIVLFLLCMIGLFIKNSFVIYLIGLNIFNAYNFTTSKKLMKENLSSVFFAVLSILAVFIYWFLFLSRGSSIPAEGNGITFTWINFFNGLIPTLVESFFACLSCGAILANIHDGLVSYFDLNLGWSPLGLMFGAIILIFTFNLIKESTKNQHFYLFNSVLLVFLVSWFLFKILGSVVSTEDRLFFPVSVLFLPIFIERVMSNRKNKLNRLFIFFILLTVLFGIYSIPNRIRNYNISGSSIAGNLFFKDFKVFSYYDKTDLEFFQRLDLISNSDEKLYLVVPNAEIGMLLKTNHILVTPPPMRRNDTAIQKLINCNVKESLPYRCVVISPVLQENEGLSQMKFNLIDRSANFFAYRNF